MSYLLDTHTFIWFDNDPDKLSTLVAAICSSSDNDLLLSLASVWEIQIKSQLGKLQLPLPLPDMIQNQITRNRVELLPIELSHILNLANLPPHHKDPFDRLLIAQAMSENVILLSNDAKIEKYPVQILW
jgi:PIN domain nuclease of toxin-antitoxin system